MVKHIFSIAILIATISACGRSSESQEQTSMDSSVNLNSKVDRDSLLLATAKKDTLDIKGRHIVFFSISQPEYDAYPKGPNSGIDEVLSDFNYYSNQVADSLSALGFDLTATASRFIRINLKNDSTFLFDRLTGHEHVVGRIYSNNSKVMITYGVATDIDIFAELDEFE